MKPLATLTKAVHVLHAGSSSGGFGWTSCLSSGSLRGIHAIARPSRRFAGPPRCPGGGARRALVLNRVCRPRQPLLGLYGDLPAGRIGELTLDCCTKLLRLLPRVPAAVGSYYGSPYRGEP